MDLIIFDLDGTLIDSEAIILGAQYETFALCNRVHPGREAGLGVIGLTLDIALMRLAGLAEPDDVLTQTYRDVFNGKRPDLAQRAECRKEARGKGLDADALKAAIAECGRSPQG